MPFSPAVPHSQHLGELKDLAQDVISASASLEGRVAPKTAHALGEHLRLVNSYYSNLIEGHRTFIPEIQRALEGDYSNDEKKKYAQELCAAHVLAERTLMSRVRDGRVPNVSSPGFIAEIHKEFYSHLPAGHQFCHGPKGFTEHPVTPGLFRDLEVSLREDGSTHGPHAECVGEKMEQFGVLYDPRSHHGDERLVAMAAAHHRLSYIHPFRDGNGRVCRLHSGLFMAAGKINHANLWSLSRGLSRVSDKYMLELFSVDPAPDDQEDKLSERLADFCYFFLNVCKDQIQFMTKLLYLEEIEPRIEFYARMRTGWKNKAFRNIPYLLRALFMRGEVPRGEVPSLLNTSETSSRRVTQDLERRGLMTSAGPKSPWLVALPMNIMPHYFPSLFQADVLGEEYVAMLEKQS